MSSRAKKKETIVNINTPTPTKEIMPTNKKSSAYMLFSVICFFVIICALLMPIVTIKCNYSAVESGSNETVSFTGTLMFGGLTILMSNNIRNVDMATFLAMHIKEFPSEGDNINQMALNVVRQMATPQQLEQLDLAFDIMFYVIIALISLWIIMAILAIVCRNSKSRYFIQLLGYCAMMVMALIFITIQTVMFFLATKDMVVYIGLGVWLFALCCIAGIVFMSLQIKKYGAKENEEM